MANLPNYFRDFMKSETLQPLETKTLISERWIGFNGICFLLGVGIQDMPLWANSEFNVLINGIHQLDYGKIVDRIGSIDLMTPVNIFLPAGCTIEFIARNGGASPSIFMGRLQCQTL